MQHAAIAKAAQTQHDDADVFRVPRRAGLVPRPATKELDGVYPTKPYRVWPRSVSSVACQLEVNTGDAVAA